jgi:hypothetical protein
LNDPSLDIIDESADTYANDELHCGLMADIMMKNHTELDDLIMYLAAAGRNVI